MFSLELVDLGSTPFSNLITDFKNRIYKFLLGAQQESTSVAEKPTSLLDLPLKKITVRHSTILLWQTSGGAEQSIGRGSLV